MSSFLSVAISFSHFILFTFLFCLLFCCCSDDVQKITPDDIYKFFCHKIYGTEDPSNTDQPRVRSTTIAYMKKSISYFMNSTGKWNESENRGNPTQSKKVNNIIKAMKKVKLGALAQTRKQIGRSPWKNSLPLLNYLTRGTGQWHACNCISFPGVMIHPT